MAQFPLPSKWDLETDIIVVGAGNAGLPAAIQAHDLGARVVVLEILSGCMGSLPLINVGPAFAGTDVQKELGIDDSPEELYKDGVEMGQGVPEMWRAYADNQLECYRWCQEIGMNLGKDLFAPPGHRRKRGIWKKGTEMIAALEKTAKAKGIDIRFQHRATRLYQDSATGRIVGVKVTAGGKDYAYKATKGVILASGGFSRNKEMVEEYGPYFADWLPTAGKGHLGDGLKMALGVGAGTKWLGHAASGSFGVDIDTKSGIMDFVGFAGGISVNVNGERFADESCRAKFYGILTEKGMSQPGKVWFDIIDDWIMQNTYRPQLMHKAVPVKANTLEELAEKLGIDPAGLKATVEKYNQDLETVGYDTVQGRTTKEGVEGKPFKIATAPFYGFKCTGATSSFKAGLAVNGKTEVLNQYGEPIEGLYAAGEVAGGLWGPYGTYMACVMVAQSLTFGRVAARTILGK